LSWWRALWARVSAMHTRVVPWLEQAAKTWHERLQRHPLFGEVYEFVDGVFVDYARNHGPMYAGALAFYAFLSLIPLLVLLASVWGFVLFSNDTAALNQSLQTVLNDARKLLPYLQPEVLTDLQAIVEHRRSLGVIGFVALMLAASEVFRGMEFALARVFARLQHARPDVGATKPRSYFKSKLVFGAFATSAALVLLLLRVLWSLARSFLSRIDSLLPWLSKLEQSSGASMVLTTVLMVIAFMALIHTFAARAVGWRYSAAGGALFAVAFHGAHAGYDVYLTRIRDMHAMYGSFAAVFILLLWMYFCATLLLLCCEVVKWLQRRVREGPRWPKDGAWLVLEWPVQR
jgi:membrane protein